jgi:uncharacterized protein (UPF0332 family)
MKLQTAAFIGKSRGLLAQAEKMLAVDLAEAAGRTAYLAGLHAAQALIFERTGKIIKRHRGLQAAFRRLTEDEPGADPEMRSFLGRTYQLKTIADYDTDPASAVTFEQAQQAIQTAGRLITCIETLLA